MRTTPSRAVAAGAALLALLAGCAGPGPGTSTPDPTPVTSAAADVMVRASDATASAGSARVAMRTTQRVGQSSTMTSSEGTVDFTGGQVQLAIRAGVPGQAGDPNSVQLVMTGGHTYLKAPAVLDKWIDSRIQDLGVSASNPMTTLEQLHQIAGLHRVGEDPVDGEPAVKYTGTVDVGRALESGPLAASLTPQQVRQLREQLADAGITSADVAVWVDRHGRVVRFDQTIDYGTGDRQVTVQNSVTFFDFGVATDIAAPAPDEIATKAELEAANLGALGK